MFRQESPTDRTAAASVLADKLATRRRSNSICSVESQTSRSSKDKSPVSRSRSSREGNTGVDVALFSNMIDLFKQEVHDEFQQLHTKMDRVISKIDDPPPSCTASDANTLKDVPIMSPKGSRRHSFVKALYDKLATDVKADFACMYGKSLDLNGKVAHGINIAPSPPAKPPVYNDEHFENSAPVKPYTMDHPASEKHESKPALNRQESRLSEQTARSACSFASSFGVGAIFKRARDRGFLARIAWLYLEDPQLVPAGRMYHRIMALLVVASCLLMILQTMQSPPFSRFTETVLGYAVDGIITFEILLRLGVCPNRKSFWVDWHNLLDMLNGPVVLIIRATLPFVIEDDDGPQGTVNAVLNSGLPLLRLLKLLRRFEGAHLIYTALHRASEALPVLIYVLFVIITIFASILYTVEPRSNIGSLPEAWWFAIVTLSTVGYGDVTPVTAEGKLAVGFLIVGAALYMAMPLGVVGKIFSDIWEDRTAILLTKLARRRFRIAGYTAADIPAMFFAFDKNQDGVLSKEEFNDMMKQMQLDTSGERADVLFKVFDSDGSGCIEDREFLFTLFPESVYGIYGSEGTATSSEDATDCSPPDEPTFSKHAL